MLVHNVIAPNFGDLHQRLDGMETTAATGKVAAFKVYTAWGPNGHGFALDDPAIGLPVVQKAHDLGVKVVVAHKGLPLVDFDPRTTVPKTWSRCRASFPTCSSSCSTRTGTRTTPKARTTRPRGGGIDRLLAALDAHHVTPNSNVWVDIASVWRNVLRRPQQAAHMLGKLLSRVGEDRVLWGTDAVWYGSPQPQIMAFRAFQITPEFQERYGYPALTDGLKRKVFGLNAARLFGVDPDATRCGLAADPLAVARAEAWICRRPGWCPRRGGRTGRPRGVRCSAGWPLAGDPLDPVVAAGPRRRPEHTFRAHGPTRGESYRLH